VNARKAKLRGSLVLTVVGLIGVVALFQTAPIALGGHRSVNTAVATIKSTLDGKSSLPFRIRWIATPSGGGVASVNFLIDGKLTWVEHKAPYVFNGDDNGANKGYLITTWLTPGSHRFTARANFTDGTTTSETVTATVSQPPAPPAALTGFWTRIVTAKDLKKGDKNGPPAGPWTLVFDRTGAWHLDPKGSGVVNEYDVRGNVIHVYAPIQMTPRDRGVSKYGGHNIGGTDCTAAGPFGSYKWSASAGKLVLKAIHEGCGNRRAIWEGTWTRKK
jgi:hypothetical protein